MISTHYEEEFWHHNHLVIGIDEAGRGALAGPVSAAAVILRPDRIPLGLNDSKVLTAAQRSQLATEISSVALSWSVALVDHDRIDNVNILQATFDAMHQAINACMRSVGTAQPLHLLVDGNRFRPHLLPHTTIVHGDGLSASIAAASIMAKTSRDAWMTDIDAVYPEYGFAQHKGYGTAAHRDTILRLGPCSIHRRTFLKKLTSVAQKGEF
ncbi:MAG TPA: ribonuclease HII [Candidatus Didemnitutus sp.]|nr:ribonuclease HII [Candidatus Didemnitutus sp.]